jgi:Fe-S-cluster containining protein
MPTSNNLERFEFPKDVRFECSRCALCCGDTEAKQRTILLLRSEAERISRTASKKASEFAHRKRGAEPYAYAMRKKADGKCVFLADNLCTIYGIRPLICRFYPFRLDNPSNGEYVFSVTQECPGVGKGRQFKRRYFDALFAEFAESMRQNNQ